MVKIFYHFFELTHKQFIQPLNPVPYHSITHTVFWYDYVISAFLIRELAAMHHALIYFAVVIGENE